MRKLLMYVAIFGGLLAGGRFSIGEAADNQDAERILNPSLPAPQPTEEKPLGFAGDAVPLQSKLVARQFAEQYRSPFLNDQNLKHIVAAAACSLRYIEPIIQKYGLPDDFKYLALVESQMKTESYYLGAAGVWQFLAATARGYGLEVSTQADERLHLEKATEAACKYIRDAYKVFGDWTLAAASYNMGIEKTRRLMKAQGVNNFYDLRPKDATILYVYRILALKQKLAEHEIDLAAEASKVQMPPLKHYTVNDRNLDLNRWARANGLNMKVLRQHNPWVKSDTLANPQGRTYSFVYPDASPDAFASR